MVIEKDLKKRDDCVDLVRAVGVFLMVMGHIGFGRLFDKWIHVFHMPMFFIISGYFWKDMKLKQILEKRVRSLLLPYISIGVLHCIVFFFIIGEIDYDSLYILFWENTKNNGVPIAGALWFLTAMFACNIIYYIIWNFSLKNRIKHLLTIIISIIGFMGVCLPFRLPYAIDAGMVGILLYHTGRLLKVHNDLIKKYEKYMFIGIIIFSYMGMINGNVNMRTGDYSNILLFYINSIGMTISIWGFVQSIRLQISKRTKLFYYLMTVGRNSIVYLCFNQIIIKIVRYLMGVGGFFDNTKLFFVFIQKIIEVITVFLIIFFLTIIFDNTKLKLLLGKKL